MVIIELVLDPDHKIALSLIVCNLLVVVTYTYRFLHRNQKGGDTATDNSAAYDDDFTTPLTRAVQTMSLRLTTVDLVDYQIMQTTESNVVPRTLPRQGSMTRSYQADIFTLPWCKYIYPFTNKDSAGTYMILELRSPTRARLNLILYIFGRMRLQIAFFTNLMEWTSTFRVSRIQVIHAVIYSIYIRFPWVFASDDWSQNIAIDSRRHAVKSQVRC